MKAKVIRAPEEPEVFEPVTIQVTFETADELRELWYRLCVSWVDIRKTTNFPYVAEPDSHNSRNLWVAVDNILCERGLKKQ